MEKEIIKFGSYYQNSEVNKEPLEWIVLDKDGNKMLLVSRYVIDFRALNEKLEATTWEHCTLRKWLINDFYKLAFSTQEQKHIFTTKIKNLDDRFSNTNGGNKTYDKVFLLSLEEVEKYLKEYKCQATPFANQKNEFANKEYAYWWLRSVGQQQYSAYNIANNGKVMQRAVHCDYYGIRPAIWVDLHDEAVFVEEEKSNLHFGRYFQVSKEQKTPIKWRVLKEAENTLLLVSEDGLEHLPFDNNCSPKFKNSSLKKWLNIDFFNEAFNDDEKAKILGDIRLLNFDEVMNYFDDRLDRKINVTPYLISINPKLERFREYWLETQGVGDCVMMINSDGSINKGGILARFANIIRPVILIKK